MLGRAGNDGAALHGASEINQSDGGGRGSAAHGGQDEVQVRMRSEVGVERAGFRIFAGQTQTGCSDVPGSRGVSRHRAARLPSAGGTAVRSAVFVMDGSAAAGGVESGGASAVGWAPP